METKPFWASKTLWVNVIAVGASIAGMFGLDFGLDPQTQIAVVGAVMGVVNIVLRVMTKSGVSATGS